MLLLPTYCSGSPCDPCAGPSGPGVQPPPIFPPPSGHGVGVQILEYQITTVLTISSGITRENVALIGEAKIYSGDSPYLPANVIALTAPSPVLPLDPSDANYSLGVPYQITGNRVVYKMSFLFGAPQIYDPASQDWVYPPLPDVTSAPLTFNNPYTALDTSAMTAANNAALAEANNPFAYIQP